MQEFLTMRIACFFAVCGAAASCSTDASGPVFGSWSTIASASVEGSAGSDAADWNGSELFVWGNGGSEAWIYSQTTNSWRVVSGTRYPNPPVGRLRRLGGWASLYVGRGLLLTADRFEKVRARTGIR